jgi:hypothetical protein
LQFEELRGKRLPALPRVLRGVPTDSMGTIHEESSTMLFAFVAFLILAAFDPGVGCARDGKTQADGRARVARMKAGVGKSF